ncbi:sensor histidine kinase [Zhihengliuella salsuginis]|uniref:histidine kinase n=1 Tax=Zhihengliuella salsuginis TaxID=578222 RepID=A0ABQ3GK71_9MICC|nr:sensor histidine kinase [Zhihengliuella salsuginis]GHD08920.1 histidine kinase [Zhihengliuella salsuginis]
MSLASRLFIWQLVLITVLAVALGAVSYRNTAAQIHEDAAARVVSVAATLAHDPFVRSSAGSADASAQLQEFALEVTTGAHVDFVTVMEPDGTRLTHPDPAEIGGIYLGTRDQALSGRVHVEQYVGTLGPSVRAIAPVHDDGGGIVALVAVGVTLESINVALASDIPAIVLVAVVAIAFGAVGSYLVSRYLGRTTLGLGPEELRRRFTYYNSALHSLREGLLLADARGRLVLYNDRAADLLGLPRLPADARGGSDFAHYLPPTMRDLLASGRRASDEVHISDDRILIASQHPAEGGGTVTTVQDHTQVQSLTGELETMRTLTNALRAQTHEHANRLHTVGVLIELGRTDEALAFAVEDRQASQELTDDVVRRIDEPFLSALLVGKAAEAHERGIELTLSASGMLADGAVDARDLVTITGNLLDNAFDAAASGERRVWADFAASSDELTISVADSGDGIDPELIEEFLRFGVSSKSGEPRGLGLALVRQSVRRLGGTLEIENDGGAIFTVSLPLAAAVPPAGNPEARSTDE